MTSRSGKLDQVEPHDKLGLLGNRLANAAGDKTAATAQACTWTTAAVYYEIYPAFSHNDHSAATPNSLYFSIRLLNKIKVSSESFVQNTACLF